MIERLLKIDAEIAFRTSFLTFELGPETFAAGRRRP
jgi:hypothetical protein